MKNINVKCPHCQQIHLCNIEERRTASIGGLPKPKKKISKLFSFVCPNIKESFEVEVEFYE